MPITCRKPPDNASFSMLRKVVRLQVHIGVTGSSNTEFLQACIKCILHENHTVRSQIAYIPLITFFSTVNPVLRDHCHERPPVLKDQVFLTEGPTF